MAERVFPKFQRQVQEGMPSKWKFYTNPKCRVLVNAWEWEYKKLRPNSNFAMQILLEFAKSHSISAKFLPALNPTSYIPDESGTTAPTRYNHNNALLSLDQFFRRGLIVCLV